MRSTRGRPNIAAPTNCGKDGLLSRCP
jgi:hypothetical protein